VTRELRLGVERERLVRELVCGVAFAKTVVTDREPKAGGDVLPVQQQGVLEIVRRRAVIV